MNLNEKEGELKLWCMRNHVGQGQGGIWEEMRVGDKFGTFSADMRKIGEVVDDLCDLRGLCLEDG